MYCCISIRSTKQSGQATLEAAFLLPLVLMLIMLLAQPAVLLYSRSVIGAAAAEGCRLISTRPEARSSNEKYVGFIKRRLASIPPIAIFHEHEPCSWDISLEGSEVSNGVSVSITNKQKPLPLIGSLWKLGFETDAQGYFVQRVEVRSSGLPKWATQ